MKKIVHKTIKVKIFNPTQVKRQFLGLLKENSTVLNHYVSRIEELGTTSKSKLHKETYHELRKTSSRRTGASLNFGFDAFPLFFRV